MDRHLMPRNGCVIRLGNPEPVDIHAHVVKKLPHLQAVSRFANGHHFMQSGFDFDPAANEAGGAAAGQIVPLKHQNVLSFRRQR